ncbi:hypothetical protein ANCCAN_04652 [Ancylostoma caninum]|uniref:Uncharacterized protein n=1 Tax=Ancylostoma caninum TaxID=29170 RepID=A0A368H1X2_ANCCA|nr:hypothetical protein ANCCAN_04652 [Ancylostoma caninum]
MRIRGEEISANIDPKKQKMMTEEMKGITKKMLRKKEKLSVATDGLSNIEQRSRRKSFELSEDYTTSDSWLNEVRRHFRGCTYCYGVKELGATALEKVK